MKYMRGIYHNTPIRLRRTIDPNEVEGARPYRFDRLETDRLISLHRSLRRIASKFGRALRALGD